MVPFLKPYDSKQSDLEHFITIRGHLPIQDSPLGTKKVRPNEGHGNPETSIRTYFVVNFRYKMKNRKHLIHLEVCAI